MVPNKLFSHSSQEYEVVNNNQNNQIVWGPEMDFHEIPLKMGMKSITADKPGITIIDMGKVLMECAREGELTQVHELILRGAPFICDWLGMSSLHFAAKNNHYEICEVLLRGGINREGKTKVDKTALHFAAQEGHEEIVKLLLSKNCDANCTDMLRMTPLHWAIDGGHKHVARLLIKHGANVSGVSKFNMTPLTLAVRRGYFDLVPELEAEAERQNKLGVSESEIKQAVNSIARNISKTYDCLSNSNEDLSTPIKFDVNSEKSLPTEDVSNKIGACASDDLNDEDIPCVEPITQLDSINDESQQLNYSALQLLKNHGISMLPADDPEHNLISSALQSGRKLVLSETGKKILNEAKLKHLEESTLPSANNVIVTEANRKNALQKNPQIILHSKGIPIKSNKNIVISIDTFKNTHGLQTGNNLKRPQINLSSKSENSPPKIKLTKIANNSPVIVRKGINKPQPLLRVVNIPKAHQKSNREDLPPNIELVSDTDDEDFTPQVSTSRSVQSTGTPSAVKKVASCNTTSANLLSQIPLNKCTKFPSLNLPDLCQQMFLLKKQIEDLRKESEQHQKDNISLRARVKLLEDERNGRKSQTS